MQVHAKLWNGGEGASIIWMISILLIQEASSCVSGISYNFAGMLLETSTDTKTPQSTGRPWSSTPRPWKTIRYHRISNRSPTWHLHCCLPQLNSSWQYWALPHVFLALSERHRRWQCDPQWCHHHWQQACCQTARQLFHTALIHNITCQCRGQWSPCSLPISMGSPSAMWV